MNDTMFLIFGLILVFTLIGSFIAYKIITDKIIRDQEREIAKLKTENRRIYSALSGAKYVSKLVVSKNTIDYPATAKIELRERNNAEDY